MSNFGLSCDVCNRENVGITWVNGMKFCAKCYQETFGNKLVFTNETGKFVDLLNTEMYELKISNLEHKLEEKDQRIAELEEQLKWCIRPKFKINEDVYIIWHGLIIDVEIKAIGKNEYYVDTCHFDLADGYGGIFVDEDEIFKTYEEAQAKLEELKGE